MGFLIPLTIMIGLGVFYWWATVLEKKRREKLLELAKGLGLEIAWQLDPADHQRFRRFEISQKGRVQHVKTVLCAYTGQTRMVVFDYEYVKGHGKNRVNRIFSMVLCTDARLKVPKLALEPESWGTAIASFIGVQDIDFDDDPEFSKAFQLQGTDEASVRQFMNPSRRKAILAHPAMHLEADGDTLLIMQPHFRLDAENVRKYMAQALAATEIMIDA